MSQRITIDPVTRIEGHLRVDVEVDGGVVKDAWSSGTMWRGIEVILKGRDPREAWIYTQRICGVCTTVHAIASVRAVENALGLEIPRNAQYIRNLLITVHALGDHIVPDDQASFTTPPSTSTSMQKCPSIRVTGSIVIRWLMGSPPNRKVSAPPLRGHAAERRCGESGMS